MFTTRHQNKPSQLLLFYIQFFNRFQRRVIQGPLKSFFFFVFEPCTRKSLRFLHTGNVRFVKEICIRSFISIHNFFKLPFLRLRLSVSTYENIAKHGGFQNIVALSFSEFKQLSRFFFPFENQLIGENWYFIKTRSEERGRFLV